MSHPLRAVKHAAFAPANWKATASQIGTIVFAILTVIAGLSYDLGPIAMIIKPEWKPLILEISGIATAVLWIYSEVQKHLIRNETTRLLHKHR